MNKKSVVQYTLMTIGLLGLPLVVIGMSGCQQNSTAMVEALEKQLADAKKIIADQNIQMANKQANGQPRLVHVVWFKMKPESSDQNYQDLYTELNKLTEIETVNHFEFGRFQDLGDTRAMSELDVVMQMSFQSKDDYETYQSHPVHLQLKKDVGRFLGGPPVTYDYWSK